MKNRLLILLALAFTSSAVFSWDYMSAGLSLWYDVDFSGYAHNEGLSLRGLTKSFWDVCGTNGVTARVVRGDDGVNRLSVSAEDGEGIVFRGAQHGSEAAKFFRFRASFGERFGDSFDTVPCRTSISVSATSDGSATNFIAKTGEGWVRLSTRPATSVPAVFDRDFDIVASFDRDAEGALSVIYSVSNSVTGAYERLYPQTGSAQLSCAEYDDADGVGSVGFFGSGYVGGLDAKWSMPFDVRVR